MKKLTLTLKGRDSWSRPVYEYDGNLYVDVDPRSKREPEICTKLNNFFDGEPDTPIKHIKSYENMEIDFIPFRDTWDNSFNIDNYTSEYCPFCDYDVVIYARGITACPNCAKPLAPCTVCDDCNYNTCPYGCTGGQEDEYKPVTNPTISKKEIEFYVKIN